MADSTFAEGFEEVRGELKQQFERLEHPSTPMTEQLHGRKLALVACLQALQEWQPAEIAAISPYWEDMHRDAQVRKM